MAVLSRDKLNSHLWAAADILRGSIDSADYKNYIFGFLFLKRLSDRFEEEAQLLIDGGEDEETAWTDPDFHQFFVPERPLAAGPQAHDQHRRRAEQGLRRSRRGQPEPAGRTGRHRLQR
jgi:type I restriction-modification system DNA methylase subunit